MSVIGRLRLLLATAALLLAYVIWLATAPGTTGLERVKPGADSDAQPLTQAHEPEIQDSMARNRRLADSLSSTPSPVQQLDTTATQRQFPPPPPRLPPELAAKARLNFVRMVKTRTRQDLETAEFFGFLPPEKQTLLVDLLADNEASFAENVSQRAQQGQILSEDEFKVLRETHENRVKALLDGAEYQNYQQHAATRSDRIIVQETTAHLGRPLSSDSTQRLLTVLAQERRQLLQSPAPSKEIQLEAMAQMADRIQTRAAEFLHSDEEQIALQEVLDRISRVPANAASLGSGTH